MQIIDYISENGILKVKVMPNNPKTEIVWAMDDGTLKIKSRGIPEKWKVNAEIVKFLAKKLEISKENVKIISWETSRKKLIKIVL